MTSPQQTSRPGVSGRSVEPRSIPLLRSGSSFSATPGAWRRAYRVSLANATIFLVLSWLMFFAEPGSLTPILTAPALFFAGAVISFVLMIRGGGAFAALAWFVLGAGVYFGLGVLVGGLSPDPRSVHYTSQVVLLGDLLRINILNSSSVVLVLVSAAPFAYRSESIVEATTGAREDIGDLLFRLFPTLAILAVVSLILQFTFFPVATNLVVRTFLSFAFLVVPFCLLSVGMLWSRLTLNAAIVGVAIFASAVALSVLTMSKFAVMSNLLALTTGFWIYRRSLRSVCAGLLAVGLVYVTVSPLVNEGRAHFDYDAATNSPLDRLAIVADIGTGGGANAQTGVSGPTSDVSVPLPLFRFSVAEVQGYLIQEYESQQPGNSLQDFWAAAVPRVLWPDKPIITRFGKELHEQFWATTNAQSAIAPTYSAEAYWNYGPLGVAVVSIVIGLELGWLTRRWHIAAAGRDLAFFAIAFPVALWASFVESWIAASYVGGFVTLVLLWHIARFLLLKLVVGMKRAPLRLRTLAQ